VKILFILLFSLFYLSAVPYAHAETFIFKDNSIDYGEIVYEDDDIVEVKDVLGVKKTFKKDDIQTIDRESKATTWPIEGVKEGDTKTYYKDGNLMIKSTLKNAKPVSYQRYDEVGNLEYERIYKDGKEIKSIYYNKDGTKTVNMK